VDTLPYLLHFRLYFWSEEKNFNKINKITLIYKKESKLRKKDKEVEENLDIKYAKEKVNKYHYNKVIQTYGAPRIAQVGHFRQSVACSKFGTIQSDILASSKKERENTKKRKKGKKKRSRKKNEKKLNKTKAEEKKGKKEFSLWT
jgi:hypothetical protein